MKNFNKAALTAAIFAASGVTFADGTLSDLTAAVDLTAISIAMAVVYGGMITVGIFLKGGSMIAKRLGWR